MRRARRMSSSATGATRQYPTGCVVFSGAAPSTSHARTSWSAVGLSRQCPSPWQIGIPAVYRRCRSTDLCLCSQAPRTTNPGTTTRFCDVKSVDTIPLGADRIIHTSKPPRDCVAVHCIGCGGSGLPTNTPALMRWPQCRHSSCMFVDSACSWL